MDNVIVKRIEALGGTADFSGLSLLDDLRSIRLKGSFLKDHFVDLFLGRDRQDEQYVHIRQGGTLSYDDITWPRVEYLAELFTPFTPGTPDYEEWMGIGDEEEQQINLVTGSQLRQFFYVGHTESWPNLSFVCLDDPHPENPTVYTTDHEVFFREIENQGSFLDYLNSLVTPQEFQEMMLEIEQTIRRGE